MFCNDLSVICRLNILKYVSTARCQPQYCLSKEPIFTWNVSKLQREGEPRVSKESNMWIKTQAVTCSGLNLFTTAPNCFSSGFRESFFFFPPFFFSFLAWKSLFSKMRFTQHTRRFCEFTQWQSRPILHMSLRRQPPLSAPVYLPDTSRSKWGS